MVQFSVQRDHLHLIVEAHDRVVLSRGMRGLGIRVAAAVRHILGRVGQVVAERFHARDLCTPREVRNALVYVLMNFRKHSRRSVRTLVSLERADLVDAYSSAPWFDGFTRSVGPPPAEETPVAAAETWLASKGWRRRGLIRLAEAPAR